MKCLIAVTPNGGACFISDMFVGSIDDVAIIEQSGFLPLFFKPWHSRHILLVQNNKIFVKSEQHTTSLTTTIYTIKYILKIISRILPYLPWFLPAN